MAKDKVVDIKTRRNDTRNPSHWAMVEQLVGAEGVIEIIYMMADICSDLPDIKPLGTASSTPETNVLVAEILRKTAEEIEYIEAQIIIE
jgi:hypothetical protein